MRSRDPHALPAPADPLPARLASLRVEHATGGDYHQVAERLWDPAGVLRAERVTTRAHVVARPPVSPEGGYRAPAGYAWRTVGRVLWALVCMASTLATGWWLGKHVAVAMTDPVGPLVGLGIFRLARRALRDYRRET